jgi:hypothetical protein
LQKLSRRPISARHGNVTEYKAMQSNPDDASAASGRTLELTIEFSRGNPMANASGYASILESRAFIQAALLSSSKWFFGWGSNDDAIYHFECQEELAASALQSAEIGHCVTTTEVTLFLL